MVLYKCTRLIFAGEFIMCYNDHKVVVFFIIEEVATMRKFVEKAAIIIGWKIAGIKYDGGTRDYKVHFTTSDRGGNYETVTIHVTETFDEERLKRKYQISVYEEAYNPREHFADFVTTQGDRMCIHVWGNPSSHGGIIAKLELLMGDGNRRAVSNNGHDEFTAENGLGRSFFDLFSKKKHNKVIIYVGLEEELDKIYNCQISHVDDIKIESPLFDRKKISEANVIYVYKEEKYMTNVLDMIPKQREPVIHRITDVIDYLAARKN